MYKISNYKAGTSAEVLVYGEIGDEFGGVDAAAFYSEVSALDAPAGITFRINSYGGDVFSGYAVANIIRRLPQPTITAIDGVAASIASVIAMAGDRVEIADNAMIMIHNAWSSVAVAGDARAMSEASESLERMTTTLKAIDDGIVEAYLARVQVNEDQVRQWMNAETWFTAREAERYGFVDAITEGLAVAACYVPDGRYKNTPGHLLGSSRLETALAEYLAPEPQAAPDHARRNRAAAWLNLTRPATR